VRRLLLLVLLHKGSRGAAAGVVSASSGSSSVACSSLQNSCLCPSGSRRHCIKHLPSAAVTPALKVSLHGCHLLQLLCWRVLGLHLM
jgi:hypothetical protein